MRISFISLLTWLAIVACTPQPAKVAHYPETKKVELGDTLFGESVPDPYRWLENDTSAETATWVAAQNDVTFNYLGSIPYRQAIRQRLDELQNYERITAPHEEGEYLYYAKNSGLQNHNIQYRRKGEDGAEEVFLDPNTFSKDGTTALASMNFSRDGSMVVLLIQEGGADWRKAVVMRASDRSIVGDTLVDLKFTGIAWRANDGFYYSSYDKPVGSELSAKTQVHKVYYHKLGKSQKEDEVVFGGDKTPRRYTFASLTEDEKFLVIVAANSTYGNELYMQDLQDPKGKMVQIVGDSKNNNNLVDNDGSQLIILTDADAPNSRIVKVDFSKPGRENWKDIVPETEQAIENVGTAGKKIFVTYLKDASSLVKQFDFDGRLEREVTLPQIGSVSGFGGKTKDKSVYYTFTSFTSPATVYKFDIASGTSAPYAHPKVEFNPADYETRQVFYTSKDGTRIPMFIVHRKGLELNGKNPTYLYAYGGFGISLTPTFSTSRILWLENGGVFAQPNLRGGGEYGEQWHQAGTKLRKQNVFDDFIAAGQYLIDQKYTSSQYLAIAGGSNGGLLVGATMTQRPDLARVALPAVGVMDMLRYHKFTSGAGWGSDYGSADDSREMMDYLRKYSPLHALRPGTTYPATLVTTADHDDRVVPAHSFKFAATLQECQAGDSPVLIRVDVKSGHGSSNLSKALDTQADAYAFTYYNMGVTPPMARKSM